MAAPTPTTRVAPVGIMLKNGYRSLITFSQDPNISLWEKQVTPLSSDGGEPIDQTTMWNNDYMTKAPQALIDHGNGQYTCAYDPAALTQLEAILNVEGTITELFSDGSTRCFYGYVKSATLAALAPGTQPEMTVEYVCTNWDHVNKVEAGPLVTEVAGT